MRSIEFEVKIGLFVLVGLILLTVITFSIGDFFFKAGYTIDAILNFANGVQVAAPVRLAGIDVGEIKEASVFKNEAGKTQVRLTLWLTNEAKVEKDAKVCINTLGLIGEKYVEIVPGTPGSPVLVDGDTIVGYDSVSAEQITKKGYEVVLKIERAVDSLTDILNQLKSGNGTIGKLIYEDTLYNNVEDVVKELKSMVKGLKEHPWKLLHRPRQKKQQQPEEDRSKQGNRGYF